MILGSRRWPAVLLCGWLGASAASADWLVTRDGARIETRGGWEVRGRQVVFTLANGTLSSLRLDDVDLEASASATAEAGKAPEPEAPEPEEREPVLVLTNDDIRSRAAPAAEAGAGDADGEPGAAEPGAATGAGGPGAEGDIEVQLLTWKAQPSDTVGGLEIVGTLRNVGTDLAANVEVGVTIPGEDGEILFETNAFVRSTGLAPGRHTNFRALLPNIHQLSADPIFDVRAVFLGGGGAKPRAEER